MSVAGSFFGICFLGFVNIRGGRFFEFLGCVGKLRLRLWGCSGCYGKV